MCSLDESKETGPVGTMQVQLSQDPFELRPLKNKTSIRLIKVCRTKINGHMACRIYHFDDNQQEPVEYHALSYLWGDSTPTEQVYLQDQGTMWHPLPLHQNLWWFLDYAWRHKLFNQFLWTDRLCIDQNNPEELSQQVPRMHAIYRNATLVVLWLQSPEQEQKHQDLIEIVRCRKSEKSISKARYKDFQALYRAFKARYRAFKARNGPSREVLPQGRDPDLWRQLMNNDYWQRAWIVQEVVVAKKACVTFEDISIDFDELPALLEQFRWPNYVRYEYEEAVQESAFWALFKMRAGGGKIPLWRVLMDFMEMKSSLSVDRVYGLLGVVANHDDGSSPVDNIEVDYNKPFSHVLLDAAFESSPPLEWYWSIGFTYPCDGEDFLKDVQRCGDHLSCLQDYIASSKTAQRHRDLAALALQTLDAFEHVALLLRHSNIVSIRQMQARLFGNARDKGLNLKPTLDQSAALIGIIMAQSYDESYWPAKERDNAAKARRHRRVLSSSPWRCKIHRSHKGGHTDRRSNEVAIGVAWEKFVPEVTAKACGEQSPICDGSSMTFEIPQIGLRLLVKTKARKRDGTLSLYLTGTKDSTMRKVPVERRLKNPHFPIYG